MHADELRGAIIYDNVGIGGEGFVKQERNNTISTTCNPTIYTVVGTSGNSLIRKNAKKNAVLEPYIQCG